MNVNKALDHALKEDLILKQGGYYIPNPYIYESLDQDEKEIVKLAINSLKYQSFRDWLAVLMDLNKISKYEAQRHLDELHVEQSLERFESNYRAVFKSVSELIQ